MAIQALLRPVTALFILILFTSIHVLSAQSSGSYSQDEARYYYSKFIRKAEIASGIELLASDSLEGRGFGTLGTIKASDFIASKLKSYGVKPAGDRQTFFQPFHTNKWNWSQLTFTANNTPLQEGRHFMPRIAETGNNIHLDADHVMFMGYGIRDKNYDDYSFAQVRNEVILIHDGEPFHGNRSVITGSDSLSDWSHSLRKKVILAVEKGAKAILLVVDSIKNRSNISPESGNSSFYSDEIRGMYPIPVIRVSKAAISQLFAGKELKKYHKYLSRVSKGHISSNFLSSLIQIRLSASSEKISDRNVVGMVEGSDLTLKDEYIVLSAHYDHLGKTDSVIYNGADDNASGTAALMETARALQAYRKEGFELKRTILVIFFTGEEKGLLGSAHYIKKPVKALRQTKAVINADMIGRNDGQHDPEDNYIYVIGPGGINSTLDFALRAENSYSVNYQLDHRYNKADDPQRLYYRSDHYHFSEQGIPSVFLFGGFHADYHQPTDDTHRVNMQKVEDVARLIYFTTIHMANLETIRTRYKD